MPSAPLAAGLAHGVRQLFQGVKGDSYFVDIGIEKQDTEKLKNGWAIVQRNITGISDLVLDPRSYSKQRESKSVACDPNTIAAGSADLMDEKAHSHDFVLTTDGDRHRGAVVMASHTLHRFSELGDQRAGYVQF